MGDSPENSDFAGDVSRLVEQAKEIQDSAASLISRTTLEEDALRRRLASLDAHINSLRNSKHADDKVCIHDTHTHDTWMHLIWVLVIHAYTLISFLLCFLF